MRIAGVTVPAFMTRFHCVGASCRVSCCCMDWNIYIDRAAAGMYRHAAVSEELRRRLDEKITANRADDDFRYARVVGREGEMCPFLDDGWCLIQRELGEDALSEVCRTFPRLYRLIGGQVEFSGDLGCPEIARLLLTSDRPVRTAEHGAGVLGPKTFQADAPAVTPAELPGYRLGGEYLDGLMYGGVGSLEYRLVQWGMFFRLAEQRRVVWSDLDAVRTLVAGIGKLNAATPEPTVAFAPLFQLSLVLELRRAFRFRSQFFPPLEAEVFEVFGIGDGFSLSDRSEACFRAALGGGWRDFLRRHPAARENLWSYWLYQRRYRFFAAGGQVEFIYAAIRYAVIRFYLAGAAAAEGGLTSERAAEIVSVCERTFRDTAELREFISRLIVENGFDNLSFLLMLLREADGAD